MSIRFYNFWSNDAAINKIFYYTHCGDAILAVNDKSTRQNDLCRVLFSWKLQETNQGEQESREGYGFLTGVEGVKGGHEGVVRGTIFNRNKRRN